MASPPGYWWLRPELLEGRRRERSRWALAAALLHRANLEKPLPLVLWCFWLLWLFRLKIGSFLGKKFWTL